MTAAELRDEGMARADEAEHEEWKVRADAAISDLAPGCRFTADDIRTVVGDPSRPKAMGSRLMYAARRGLIVDTGTVRHSERPVAHARKLTVWERV